MTEPLPFTLPDAPHAHEVTDHPAPQPLPAELPLPDGLSLPQPDNVFTPVHVEDQPAEHIVHTEAALPELPQSFEHVEVEQAPQGHGFEPVEPSPVEQPATEAASPRARKPRSNGRRGGVDVSPRQVRDIIAKHEVVSRLHDSYRDLIASVVGAPAKAREDAAALTAHIVTSGATPRGLRELREIHQATAAGDPFAAIVVATSHEATARQQWAILSALGAVTGPIPSKELHAAAEITRAASQLGAEQLDDVEALFATLGAR